MIFSKTQQKAIEFKDGVCMCLAGPGSGKTTVLTGRVHNLIKEHKVRPENILVITFTKAAATEMQTRFYNLCQSKLPVTFGTFHAVFFSILKAAYNYSVDNILKEEEKERIIRQAVEKYNPETNDMADTVHRLKEEISKVKAERINISAYYSLNCPAEVFRDIYNYYVRYLNNTKLLDFDDMLLYCYELLIERKDILKKWQDRYKYILIDEFQDINRIQYDIIRMLALPHNNIFIVGDDDQSIYGFRGSKPEIMLNFQNDYPKVNKIYLDKNYRSTENIVKASSYVISVNKVRFAKNIRTDNPAGDKVDIYEFNDFNEQYDRVVETVKTFVKAGKKYSDYAVLFRTNAIIGPLVRRLMMNNIPFVLKDGIPNIFDHWIYKDIEAYMVLALGDRSRKNFIRIMNKPLRYIGRDYVTDSEISFGELEKYYEGKPWMIERLDKLEKDLHLMSDMTPFGMINYIRKGIGYDDYLKIYADEHDLDSKELVEIIEEIMEVSRGCRNYKEFKEYIEEYSKNLKESHKPGRDKGDAVTLTTMHSAKGLEYDTVFIIDANEEITPHKKAVTEADIEEERRMFYVAMTRAKNNLKIMYAKERYNKELEVSRFVREIMDERRKEI